MNIKYSILIGIFLLFIIPEHLMAQASYIQRVNAGGSNYTAAGGDTFDADQEYTTGSWGYVGGNTYSTGDPIANTNDDELYQTERFRMSAYRFDVQNGDYEVVLHFAEIFVNGQNRRKMSVAIEGQTVLDSLDIFAEVGHDAALSYTYSNIAVTDGRLDITFSSIIKDPKISAIEVLGTSLAPVLSANPTTLDFGSSQSSLNFTVTNSGGSTLNWDAYENPDESWITSVSPASGSLNAGEEATVTVTIDRSGLSDGSYTGNISVTSNGGDQDVLVNMTVSSSPTLLVTPVTLNFGATSVSKTFDVSNSGGGTLTWNATENPDESWITSISPASGSLTENQSQTVTVEIDRSGLEDGDYSGIISVTSNGGDQDVTVNMTVSSQPGYIRRVNAGGSGYTSGGGDTFDADQQYTTGSWGYVDGNIYSTSDPIANTDDDELYQTERYGMSAYQFDVPNGDYDVVLHFAEIFLTGRNLRKMSVAIEGQTVLTTWIYTTKLGMMQHCGILTLT